MTVGEMIEHLKKFDPSLEVLVTDGYNCHFYKGAYSLTEFTDNGVTFVDIGIGVCLEEDENESY